MNDKPTTELHPDAELIKQLGGPTVLARRLGYPIPGGTARVSMWRTRGIPELIRLKNPRAFKVKAPK